jgi:hypothetical protein
MCRVRFHHPGVIVHFCTGAKLYMSEVSRPFPMFYPLVHPLVQSKHFIQGGSDISGTLSKLHHRIKKSYFLLIISHKTVSALFRRGNKKKQTRSGNY